MGGIRHFDATSARQRGLTLIERTVLIAIVAILIALLLAADWGEAMPVEDRVCTTPVKGRLQVDGEPAAAVKVQCVSNSAAMDDMPV